MGRHSCSKLTLGHRVVAAADADESPPPVVWTISILGDWRLLHYG